MVADKDIDAVLRLLPADAVYYFTQPASHRALPAADLLARWRALHSLTNTRSLTRSHQHAVTNTQAMAFPTVAEAVAAARAAAAPDDVIFIGGSNYVVGEALRLYQ